MITVVSKRRKYDSIDENNEREFLLVGIGLRGCTKRPQQGGGGGGDSEKKNFGKEKTELREMR